MRFKTNVNIFRGRMDLAPLVDVVFILVVFFLISTSYDFQPGHKVNLPKGNAPIVMGDKLVVVVTTKEKSPTEKGIVYFFNNEEVSVQDLDVKLNERINSRSITIPGDDGKTRYPTISLKVDQDVPYMYVQKVFQIAYERKVNINQVIDVTGN